MTTKNWLKSIPKELLAIDEIPLLGDAPSCPWEQLQHFLKEALQLPDLTLSSTPWQWRLPDQLFEGFGDTLSPLTLSLPPHEGELFWAMSSQDLAALFQLLIPATESGGTAVSDPDFEEAFYHLLGLEVIAALRQCQFPLSLQLHGEHQLPKGEMLCCDVSFTVKGREHWGRLFLSPALRRALREQWMIKERKQFFASPTAEQLQLTLQIEAGRFDLLPKDWSAVRPGDFLPVEQCTLKPDLQKGRVVITLNDTPLFNARIKKNKIKILSYPLYHEVSSMEDEEELEEEFEEEPEESFEEEDEELEEEDFEEEEGEAEEEEELEEGEEDLEEEDEEDLEEEEGEFEEGEELEEEAAVPAAEKPPAPLSAPEEIPLPVVIEVGRIQMAVSTLSQLEPGNLLDLELHPERGVDLVVHGRRIARGELVLVGETLGVRVLEVG